MSDSDRPGTQSSENAPRRAWHRPQVSTSLRSVAGGKLRRGIAGLRIDRPGDIAPFVEANEQPLVAVFDLAERPPALLGLRPGDVPRPLPVTGLAADADFRPGRGEAIVLRIVVLAHAGRVALGAHEIPVLIELGPMQDVVVLDLFVRVEMKPALAALVLRPAIPGDRQRLQPAVGKFDQILLQRIEAERVFDLEGRKLAVGPVGLDQEFSVLAKEARSHAVIVEARIVEIAEHRFVGRMVHRMLVLRRAPQLGFARWQPAQVSLPTKVATGVDRPASLKSCVAGMPTTNRGDTAPTKAAVIPRATQMARFNL